MRNTTIARVVAGALLAASPLEVVKATGGEEAMKATGGFPNLAHPPAMEAWQQFLAGRSDLTKAEGVFNFGQVVGNAKLSHIWFSQTGIKQTIFCDPSQAMGYLFDKEGQLFSYAMHGLPLGKDTMITMARHAKVPISLQYSQGDMEKKPWGDVAFWKSNAERFSGSVKLGENEAFIVENGLVKTASVQHPAAIFTKHYTEYNEYTEIHADGSRAISALARELSSYHNVIVGDKSGLVGYTVNPEDPEGIILCPGDK